MLDRTSSARGPVGPRGRPAGSVQQQPQADRPGHAQLPHLARDVPAGWRLYRRLLCWLQHHGWGSWSAQALLLGYLEQMPLYNAANFSWAVGMGQGFAMNSTVSTSYLQRVRLPVRRSVPHKDPATGSLSCWQWTGATNNYLASMGTTTNYGGLASDHHRCLHPRRQCLRRAKYHRRDLQYDRIRRITGRRRHNRDGEVPGWPGAHDGVGRVPGGWCGVNDISTNLHRGPCRPSRPARRAC